MTVRDDAPDLQAEVQRLLGRCLLRLQQCETLTNNLIACHRLSGPAHELGRMPKRCVEDIATKTLGQQIRGLLKSCFIVGAAPLAVPHASGHGGAVQMSAEDYARTQAELRSLLAARNELVHRFIGRFDLRSPEGCAAACAYLDGCHARFDAHYARLCAWATRMDEGSATAAVSMQTPEFVGRLLDGMGLDRPAQWERASIVGALREAIAELRAGEWARLDRAVALIRARQPRQTPARYGCKSWGQLLEESRVFELRYRADERDGRVAWFRERGR